MKKFIFVVISVLLLTSCTQAVQPANGNVSATPEATATAEATQTPAAPVPSASAHLPSPSPTVSSTPSNPTMGSGIQEPLPTSTHFSDTEKVSKTLTIGDVKKFIKTPPKELFEKLGDVDVLGYVEDIDAYVAGCDSLDITIHYSCDFEDNEESFVEIPKLPVKRIIINNFKFRGLSEESAFKDVINTLGKTKLYTGHGGEGSEYYYLRYKIIGLWFEFVGEDKTGSDGIGLEIVP